MPFFLGIVILLLGGFCPIQAQYRVTFHITQLPSYTKADSGIYLAGSINNWNPRNERFRLKENTIVVQMPKGEVEYKFTRGDWQHVETSENGASIENRKAQIESDTIINVAIKGWADHYQHENKKSTASRQVHILDTSFYMPQLKRQRRIWIYLPKSYTTSHKKYPVLYMQDGQNVFDAATSFSGEWGVDEALDTLGPKYKESIVVAVDNGGDKRLNEYSPYDMPKYGKGEGDQYVDFLAHTLKPYIDTHFRTLKSAAHTAIAGSSMGGLISFYAILKYPDIFGNAGVFSPAFWIAPIIKEAILQMGKKVKGRIYFYAGKEESESMIPNMLAVFEQMHQVSKSEMTTVIREGGKHNEADWSKEFPAFYKWLMLRDKRGKGGGKELN